MAGVGAVAVEIGALSGAAAARRMSAARHMRMMVGRDNVVVFGGCCNMGSAVGVVGGGSMPDRVAAHSHAEEPAGHLNSHAVAVVEVAGVAVVGVGVAVACGMTVLAPLLS